MVPSRLPPQEITGSLAQIVWNMNPLNPGASRLETTQLMFLQHPPHPKPYQSEAGMENETVTMYGRDVRRVGITRCDTVDTAEFIVSDSFGPCVPVVAMHGRTTSLAHCDFQYVLEEFAATWDRDDASIIIVQKARLPAQAMRARLAFEILTRMGFRYVSLCVVPTGGLLGVIVRGNAILTYGQVTSPG